MVELNLSNLTQIAEGGEGLIYEHQGKIVKIFKPHIDLIAKQRKLTALLSKQLPPSVVKPIQLASVKGKFAGYVMVKVNGEEVKRLSNKKHIKIHKITYKDILKILVDIKNTLELLHAQNIFVGDLNELNILFDSDRVYFIDCDSWAIDNEPCTVAMDSFKDPLLKNNDFNNKTDFFAYAILVFKSLAKIHPYGGTLKPDIGILERMSKGIHVIDNPNVIIPKTIPQWNFIPPYLLDSMKGIFSNAKREVLDMNEYANNLKQCPTDKQYYYVKFAECPFCNSMAKIVAKPQKISSDGALMPVLYFTADDIEMIVAPDIYKAVNGTMRHIKSGSYVAVGSDRINFSNDGDIVYRISDDGIEVLTSNNSTLFPKLHKSMAEVHDRDIYYVTPACNFVKLTIGEKGNHTQVIAKTSFNSFFSVVKDNYFICNVYDGKKIFNINGYNYVFEDVDKIANYGLHFDKQLERWLLVIENQLGVFRTMIFDRNEVKYDTDNIKYTSDLANICFDNFTIFTPNDGFIRGFNYKKNLYKDFDCQIVTEDSKLIKDGKRFMIINDTEIWTL